MGQTKPQRGDLDQETYLMDGRSLESRVWDTKHGRSSRHPLLLQAPQEIENSQHLGKCCRNTKRGSIYNSLVSQQVPEL